MARYFRWSRISATEGDITAQRSDRDENVQVDRHRYPLWIHPVQSKIVPALCLFGVNGFGAGETARCSGDRA